MYTYPALGFSQLRVQGLRGLWGLYNVSIVEGQTGVGPWISGTRNGWLQQELAVRISFPQASRPSGKIFFKRTTVYKGSRFNVYGEL